MIWRSILFLYLFNRMFTCRLYVWACLIRSINWNPCVFDQQNHHIRVKYLVRLAIDKKPHIKKICVPQCILLCLFCYPIRTHNLWNRSIHWHRTAWHKCSGCGGGRPAASATAPSPAPTTASGFVFSRGYNTLSG